LLLTWVTIRVIVPSVNSFLEKNILQLRPYQQDLEAAIYRDWRKGSKNVLAVLPTGAGKTVIFAKILADHKGPCCAIAHRQELVGQISLALATLKVRHRIIGPSSVIKFVVKLHMSILGHSFYDPNAVCAVAGIDTLIRRKQALSTWLNSVTLWVQDEAHHVQSFNKWGIGCSMLPNARGLGVTATAIRADGKGLGRWNDGVFDSIVVGPEMRYLIDEGYLTDYRIFAPSNDLDLSQVQISKTTGDYSKPGVVKAVRKSKIVGNAVNHYLKHVPGKLGVTFTTDVETAREVAEEFNATTRAEVVSHKTKDLERTNILDAFKRRDVLQLVNVDLFGEGFDLPAIEVASFLRPTESYSLYCQQFGRALRLLLDDTSRFNMDTREGRLAAIAASRKPHATIIDHVGNVLRHGLPDAKREWSLERRESRRSKPTDVIPVITCPACTAVYERTCGACPYCGHYAEPADRSKPEFVDGDLTELDAATLQAMRGEIEKVDMHHEQYRVELAAKYTPYVGQLAHVKRHKERQDVQGALRTSIAWWGAYQRYQGRADSESYKRFYWKFGVDVMTAQTLSKKDALELAQKINFYLGENT